jgi:hypothetical protein
MLKVPRAKWIAPGAVNACADGWNSSLAVSPSAPFSSVHRTLPDRTASFDRWSYWAFSARTVTGAPRSG